jgi:ATP-binding cassette, subfamily A (ABC1), member 3
MMFGNVSNFLSSSPDLVTPVPPWPDVGTEHLTKKYIYLPNIAFSPANPVLQRLISLVAEAAGYLVTPLENANALQQFLIAEGSFVGVEFPASYAGLTTLPDQLNYSLRFPGELRMFGFNGNPLNFNWRTDFRFPQFLTGVRNRNSQHGGFPTGYYAERFVQVQHMIFEAYVQVRGLVNEGPDTIFLRRFPYPSHTRDTLLLGLESVIALLILLSFIYPSINMVKFVTTEKEKQLKEAMKIMGLANWLHWTAWFVKFLSFLSISLVLMTIMVCVSTHIS